MNKQLKRTRKNRNASRICAAFVSDIVIFMANSKKKKKGNEYDISNIVHTISDLFDKAS